MFWPVEGSMENRVPRVHQGKVVTRLSFSALFLEVWKSAMTMHNIISAFRVTGIFPCLSSSSYILLLTPAPRQKRKPITPSFSEAEMKLFLDDHHKTRAPSSNGDKTEERYQLCAQMYQPLLEQTCESPLSLSDSFLLTPTKNKIQSYCTFKTT